MSKTFFDNLRQDEIDKINKSLNRFCRYIRYTGQTIYTPGVYKSGWYTKISDTFLTNGSIYKLNKPVRAYDVFESPTELDIEDDVMLKMTEQEKKDHSNYHGTIRLNPEYFSFLKEWEVRDLLLKNILNEV